MPSVHEKKEYLLVDLSYELLMLRHAFNCVTQIEEQAWNHEPRQLDWNAYFEAFGVHARNLVKFLGSKDDSRNMKAKDYCAGFKPTRPDFSIDRWERGQFHMSKARPDIEAQGKKLTSLDANKVFDWIETNFKKFIDELDEPYNSAWDPGRADPKRVVSGQLAAATNAIEMTTTTTDVPSIDWSAQGEESGTEEKR